MKKEKLYQFYSNLKKNYYDTINNFLSTQMIGLKTPPKDLKYLKKMLSYEDQPNNKLLKNGLEMLLSTDLRHEKNIFQFPFLRIYGALDNLVPKKICQILDAKWPNSSSVIINKAAHTPFISHKEKFCSILLEFIKSL